MNDTTATLNDFTLRMSSTYPPELLELIPDAIEVLYDLDFESTTTEELIARLVNDRRNLYQKYELGTETFSSDEVRQRQMLRYPNTPPLHREYEPTLAELSEIELSESPFEVFLKVIVGLTQEELTQLRGDAEVIPEEE